MNYNCCVFIILELDPNFVLVFGPNDFSTLHGGGTYEYALLGGDLPDLREVRAIIKQLFFQV